MKKNFKLAVALILVMTMSTSLFCSFATEETVEEAVVAEVVAVEAPAAVEEPAVEEPVIEEEPAVEETVAAEAPAAVEEAAAVEAVAVEAVAVAEEPAAEEPAAVEEAVVEEAVVEESAAEEPVVEEAVVEEPVVEEEPAVEETVVEDFDIADFAASMADDFVEAVIEKEAKKSEPKAPAAEETKAEEVVEEVVEYNGPAALGAADVRLEPNGMSLIFATVEDGTPLTVLGVEGDWAKVEVDGQVGYIYKDSVKGVAFEENEAPEEEPELKVTIFTSRRTVMTPGETIYLTSKLEGFDGYTVSYQWQYDRGNGFEDIAEATADTYAFAASIETLGYDWRLVVSYE